MVTIFSNNHQLKANIEGDFMEILENLLQQNQKLWLKLYVRKANIFVGKPGNIVELPDIESASMLNVYLNIYSCITLKNRICL